MEAFDDMVDGAVCDWTQEVGNVGAERILRIQKYKDMDRVRPRIMASAERAAARAVELCKPQCRYVARAIKRLDGDQLELSSGQVFHSGAFRTRLAECRHVVVFVMTLGPEIDAAVSEGFADRTDPIGPLFLDSAAWVTIEAATRAFQSGLKSIAAKAGHRTTQRMAPGYSYYLPDRSGREMWPLAEQAGLFAAFGGAALPVELLDSSAMMPKMSRSGLIGVR